MIRSTLTTAPSACLLGRVWVPGKGPCVVTTRNNFLIDITTKHFPTVSSLLNARHPHALVQELSTSNTASVVGTVDHVLATQHLLSPFDLQAHKACGVTFANSMLERVIEEHTGGDRSKAHTFRQHLLQELGDIDISSISPGSPESDDLRTYLKSMGLWSQYLEVGLGPDAEVFTKCQPLSSVGAGSHIGIHSCSKWNNPEPELVLAVNARGTIVGATLGNDVNLRDVEGRSALLLGKAKDNNASCSIGPMIRLLDGSYTLSTLKEMKIALTVHGESDGFHLSDSSSISLISRGLEELVEQTMSEHQYPDGFCLFTGTGFSPNKDRGGEGLGFTHRVNDVVVIENEGIGQLVNQVKLSSQCPPWEFGVGELMRNLAQRDLL